MAEEVELEIPPRPEYLALARALVASAAAGDPLFPEERLDDLRLAVSEACTNAIEAQSRAGVDDAVRLRCEITPEHLVVEVADHGAGFDPDDLVAHPPAHDPSRLEYERGLGIPLIRALSDDLEFHLDGGGTVVRMTFQTGPPSLPAV